MKKVLFLMAAAVAVMFTACKDGGNSAKDAVDAAMKCLVNNDFKGYAKFAYVDEGQDQAAQETALNLAASTAEKLYKENPVTEYEILKEEAQGEDKAVVEVKIKQKDGKETTSKMNMVKNKAGEWKIKDSNDSKADAATDEAAEKAADEIVNALGDAVKEGAEEVKDAAKEGVEAVKDAAEEAVKE